MKIPFLIIGGGLSGLAAGIRYARYSPDVLLLEKHNRFGGLNSFYYRNKILIETGLHAITNYAPPQDKQAPLNRLFRQLKLSRKKFKIHEQIKSEIHFTNRESISFTNDFKHITEEIKRKFSQNFDGFVHLARDIDNYDPFLPRDFISAKAFINERLKNDLLTDMLLCPLMYYGSSVENDMDLGQFVIMFRSIFQEGMFRPAGTIKDFLDNLVSHYGALGGQKRLSCEVVRILHNKKAVYAVELSNGEIIECDTLLSTIGYEETCKLLDSPPPMKDTGNRLGFVENIYLFSSKEKIPEESPKTIVFFNKSSDFRYQRPAHLVDFNSGVICFPNHFRGRAGAEHVEVRSTHLANFHEWKKCSFNPETYLSEKNEVADISRNIIKDIIGPLPEEPVFQDTFTPLTIKRYTAKKEGAIYGSPFKIKDGRIGYSNLYLAGTDQGFLGIIGSMLSGVSIVNQHILPKL